MNLWRHQTQITMVKEVSAQALKWYFSNRTNRHKFKFQQILHVTDVVIILIWLLDICPTSQLTAMFVDKTRFVVCYCVWFNEEINKCNNGLSSVIITMRFETDLWSLISPIFFNQICGVYTKHVNRYLKLNKDEDGSTSDFFFWERHTVTFGIIPCSL